MDLSIQSLTKSFSGRTIFKDLHVHIPSGSRWAITGRNGAGKSTLLKILSGALLPSSGTVVYSNNGLKLEEDQVYKYVHFVAPYNTIIEEQRISEVFQMHQQLGLLKSFTSFDEWHARLSYTYPLDIPVKAFSSGMKQRIKLGLALLDERPLILLDEPGSNLDKQGKQWLGEMIANLSRKQTIIIASNEPEEIIWGENEIHLPADQANF